MSELMLVLWVFGVVVAVLALASYHLARWYEARHRGQKSSERGEVDRDTVTHLLLSAWKLELQTRSHSAG